MDPLFDDWELGTLIKLIEDNLKESKRYYKDFIDDPRNKESVARVEKQYKDLLDKVIRFGNGHYVLDDLINERRRFERYD